MTGVIMTFVSKQNILFVLYPRYNVDSWLKLLSQARPKFHPQHMVMVEIAKWCVPILCRGPGLGFSHFPMALVTTKLELAINYVRVLEILEPGLSKFRAKFLFEMIDTKMFLFCEKFKREQTVDQSEVKGKLIKTLRESQILILSFPEYIDKLDDVINIFKMMGTVTAFEKLIFAKSTQLRRVCNEMTMLGIMK